MLMVDEMKMSIPGDWYIIYLYAYILILNEIVFFIIID